MPSFSKDMTKPHFMKLMKIPQQWEEWCMYPAELFEEQVARYEPGHEDASEHDRNGMFHWWLRRDLTHDQLGKLARLTLLEPDRLMAEDVRKYIRQSPNFDQDIQSVWQETV